MRISAVRLLLLACSLCCSLAFAGAASAAGTVSQEREKLAGLNAALKKQQANSSELQAELAAFPERIKEAQDELETAERELQDAQTLLTNLQNAPDSANKVCEINLQEHAVKMATRRVSTETRALDRVNRYQVTLEEDAAKATSAIARLRTQIDQQESQLIAAEQAARRESQTAALPKPEVSIPPPAPVVVAPAPAPVVATPVAEPVAKPVVEAPAVATPAAVAPVLSPDDIRAFELASAFTAELGDLLRDAPLNTEWQLNGSDISETPLFNLAGNKLRGEATVVAGKQIISVKSKRFQINVPQADEGETYIFIVDTTKVRDAKVHYFKKSLLAYLGTKPISSKSVAASPEPAAKPAPTVRKELVTLDSGKQVELTASDIDGLEIAREQMALLTELEQQKSTAKPFFSRLGLSGSQIEASVDFNHVGSEQYRAEAVVAAGRQMIRVNNKRFRIEIPEADEGETYIFIVDASKPERLQISFFKKSLLALL